MNVRVRTIAAWFLAIGLFVTMVSLVSAEGSKGRSAKDGCVSLFDGKSLAGWPDSTWHG